MSEDRPMTEEEFFAIWNSVTPTQLVAEYRLYYDENGYPLFYTSEDLPGNYIVVDEKMVASSPANIRIHDGKVISYRKIYGKKLKPSSSGQACDPWDVCVIVTPDRPNTQWKLTHEEPVDDQTN